MRRAAPIVLVLVALGALALWYFTRPQPTDEQKVLALVSEARAAVERKSANRLMRLISEDYMDKYGYDKRGLRQLATSAMYRAEHYTIYPQVTSLKFQGDLASLEIKAWFWAGDPQSGPGLELNITAKLQREGRQWRVISASGWEEAESEAMNE